MESRFEICGKEGGSQEEISCEGGMDSHEKLSIQDTGPNSCFKWYYVIFIILLIAITVAYFWDTDAMIKLWHDFIDWIKENPWKAAFVLIAIYIVCCIIMFPIPQFHILGGYVYTHITGSIWYGLLISSSIAFIGTQVGAWCAFLISRYHIQDYVINKIEENQDNKPWLNNFYLIDSLFQDGNQSIKIMVMLRLAIVPYHITNYLLGVTCLQFYNYAIGSCAYLYKCILECYIGCQMYMIEKQLREQGSKKGGDKEGGVSIWVLIQIAVAIGLNVLLALYTKYVLDEKLRQRRELEEIQQDLNKGGPGLKNGSNDSDPNLIEYRSLIRQKTYNDRRSNRKYDPLALSLRRQSNRRCSNNPNRKSGSKGGSLNEDAV